MTKSSLLFQRILLIFAGLAALGAAVWGGLRFFEPIAVPPIPPPKPHVTFDPSADIRKNPFWSGLFSLLNGESGEIEPGALGRPNPFAPVGVVSTSTDGVPSGLGTVREVVLNGGQALALAPAKAGGVLALVVSKPASGGQSYEIRRMTSDGAPVVVASWSIPTSVGPGPNTTPVALREDANGKIWLLFANGAVTPILPDGGPSVSPVAAIASANAAIASLFGDIRFDGAGRMWVTDGLSVAEGEDALFHPVDMPSQLTNADRAALGLTGSEDSATLDNFFRPWRLQMLADGRMGVVSSKFSAFFPLDLQGKPDIFVASSTESILAITPSGSVWSALLDSSLNVRGMVRHDVLGQQSFLDPVVLPKQALHNGFLMEAGEKGLVALDYVTNGTVLWREVSGSWVAQVLAPVGSQPPDAVRRIVVDEQGNVWAIMNQKGLLQISPPSLSL